MPVEDTLAARSTDFVSQEQDLARRQAALDAAGAARETRHDAEMRPLESALQHEMDTPAPMRPADTALPEPPDLKKLVDAKEYEGLSFALLGMALVGGVVSRGNWMGVSSALNGALKGYHEGNQQKAKQELERYDREFKVAKDKEAQVNKQFDDIIKNRSLTINEQLQRIRILAAQHGREDIRAAADQKSIDSMHKQIEAGKNQLAGVEQRNEAVKMRLKTQTALHNMGANAPGATAVSPAGQWLVEQTLARGDDKFAKMLTSRYGRQMAIPIINDIGEQLVREGTDPSELTIARLNTVAQQSALRVATVRKQAVERLTMSLKPLEERVAQLTTQLNGRGIPPANATLNYIRQTMGDGALQELHTLTGSVGRQYVEAITMPGSNAQMHATAQEWSQGLLNENMSIEQLAGALRGMNAEIKSTHAALSRQVGEPGEAVRSSGVTLPRPGAAAAPAAAPAAERPPANASPEDILKFYTPKAEKVPEFKTKAAADEAGAAGLLKKGQSIKIKGKNATWEP